MVLEKKSAYQLHIRLQIRREMETVYGSGISELLQRCERTHSLHAAAKQMRMPYRKALSIVKRAEDGFGKPLLEKTIGGVGGGGSQLTEYGRELVSQFRVLEKEVAAYAAQRLQVHLPFLSVK